MRKVDSFMGGVDPDELVDVIRNGFVTWIDTDSLDKEAIAVQSAMLVNAPLETVYDATTDFENTYKFIQISRKTKIHQQKGDLLDLTLRQGIGLGFLSVGIEERFRLRLNRPHSVTCEEYIHGSFKRATYEMYYHPVGPDKTLFVLSFLSDLRALGWLTRFFLKNQPEVEFAVAANLVIVPLAAMVIEAERRGGRPPVDRSKASRPLWEAIGEGKLAPALKHGHLTVGRFDPSGGILDVTSATRIGAPRQKVWEVVSDSTYLSRIISFVSNGRIISLNDSRLESELWYRVKLGPFAKKYRMQLKASIKAPESLISDGARLDGHPLEWGAYLFEDGDETLFCERYYTDIKRDWLSRVFLDHYPDFERLICAYPPLIIVRAVREALGGPAVSGARPSGKP